MQECGKLNIAGMWRVQHCRNVESSTLQECGKLNIAGMWRAQHCKNVESSTLEECGEDVEGTCRGEGKRRASRAEAKEER